MNPIARTVLPGLLILLTSVCRGDETPKSYECGFDSVRQEGVPRGEDSGQPETETTEFKIEIGAGNSFVVLENSKIKVEYGPFFENHAQFAIRNVYLKEKGNFEVVGDGDSGYFSAQAGRGKLLGAKIVRNDSLQKTVHLEWADAKQKAARKIVQEVTIFRDEMHLKIDYLNVRYGVNIVDLGAPGGTVSGEHVAQGAVGWNRGYTTHSDNDYHGSFYNRYPKDGVNDVADGGSLNYKGYFIVGVFNPENGIGIGRVMPVADISIIKLLLSEKRRRGLELFPHPFFEAHEPFTGYLLFNTHGGAGIVSTGKRIVDRRVGSPTRLSGSRCE